MLSTTATREARAGLEREAAALRRIAGPGVPTLLDSGEVEGRLFLALEYLEGTTLRERLRSGRLPGPEVLVLALSLADALDHVHCRGIVHADLKPENVLVDPEGLGHLLDFGLAEDLEAPGTGRSGGTPRYLAPEVLRGERPGAASDLYQLGLVLFEALAGRPAFPVRKRVEDALRVRMDPPPAPEWAPPALAQALEACLAPHPAGRPGSARELAAHMRAALMPVASGPRSLGSGAHRRTSTSGPRLLPVRSETATGQPATAPLALAVTGLCAGLGLGALALDAAFLANLLVVLAGGLAPIPALLVWSLAIPGTGQGLSTVSALALAQLLLGWLLIRLLRPIPGLPEDLVNLLDPPGNRGGSCGILEVLERTGGAAVAGLLGPPVLVAHLAGRAAVRLPEPVRNLVVGLGWGYLALVLVRLAPFFAPGSASGGLVALMLFGIGAIPLLSMGLAFPAVTGRLPTLVSAPVRTPCLIEAVAPGLGQAATGKPGRIGLALVVGCLTLLAAPFGIGYLAAGAAWAFSILVVLYRGLEAEEARREETSRLLLEVEDPGVGKTQCQAGMAILTARLFRASLEGRVILRPQRGKGGLLQDPALASLAAKIGELEACLAHGRLELRRQGEVVRVHCVRHDSCPSPLPATTERSAETRPPADVPSAAIPTQAAEEAPTPSAGSSG